MTNAVPNRPGLVLVDSSVWVPCLRSNPNPSLARWLREALLAGNVATTGIVRVELLQGTRTEDEFAGLATRLEALADLQGDAVTWGRAAANGFLLRRRGVSVPTTDLLIATIALQYATPIAHCDDHFELMAPHLGIDTVPLSAG